MAARTLCVPGRGCASGVATAVVGAVPDLAKELMHKLSHPRAPAPSAQDRSLGGANYAVAGSAYAA